jgi:hypothetical protein
MTRKRVPLNIDSRRILYWIRKSGKGSLQFEIAAKVNASVPTVPLDIPGDPDPDYAVFISSQDQVLLLMPEDLQ